MKKAHIISIGNELLIGDTINTNAAWIGGFLTRMGFYVEQIFTLPDSYSLIVERIEASLANAGLTIVTGGLGPTHDDVTKKAVADLFGAKMVQNDAVLEHVKAIFEKRNFLFSRANAEQAMVPENCEVLFNHQGTAPGMWFKKEGNFLAVLPGVPYEMKYLMKKRVHPEIEKEFPEREMWATEYFKTAGIPESTLSEQVGELNEYVNNGVGVAFLPSPKGVTIRISASGSDKKTAGEKLTLLKAMLYEKAGDFIFGEGRDASLAEITGSLVAERKMKLAVAESCTGGLLANTITDVPGCSAYMMGGIVAYSNHVKAAILGVSEDDLDKYGAVSGQVAVQMAAGAANALGADIGISTTGIAGPGGGTPEKPVGTVWLGFCIGNKKFALHSLLANNRLINKERTVMIALEVLRRQLSGISGLPYNLKPEVF